MKHIITQKIGSLAKPEWRVKVIANKPITQKEIDEAISWGKRLKIDYDPLIKLLKKKTFSAADKEEVKKWASIYALRMIESAGVDVVYDGEQHRSEMYQYAVNLSDGFVFRGLVRSWDNKYYQKAACIGKPKIKKPWHVEELKLFQKLTDRKIKIPITGAYTIAAWSFDEYYSKKAQELGSEKALAEREKARRKFILDVAKYLIRPNIKMLLENGAEWILSL